ncbi:MAG TPA: phosphate ABC transporter permease subunit PstC [Gemmataceae bacterium]|nr:phosphate ABC transporter permease subunit PstC [Gemmataceae bacterium]
MSESFRPARTPAPSTRPNALERGLPVSGDAIFKLICQAAAWLVIVLFALLVGVIVWKSWESIQHNGLGFFFRSKWDPESTHRQFGALAFIFGTVATSIIAMVIAVPLGVGVALFLAEISPPWFRRIGSFLVEMLAAVPSVVYGFWGLFVLAPFMQKHIFEPLGGPNQGGVGILTAGIILSIMIVPYIASVSFDVCRAVPHSQREGAYALGATRWQMIWSAVLPYARPGIIGGCFLALGRALGETMAVTMLIGNKTDISFSPFAMGNSIASVIANQFTEADYDLYLSALCELGMVLLMVSVIMNSLARLLIWRVTRPGKGLVLLRKKHLPRVDAHTNGEALSPPGELASFQPRPVKERFARLWNQVMTVILLLCLLGTASMLLVILGFLIYQGVRAIDVNFFTRLPAPVGRTGGGIANGIVGSGVMVGLATFFAVPIGLLAAIFLSEYRSDRLGPAVRFVGELLSGVPSIVIGIFGYYLLVKPMGHFSGWAGAFALGVMMIPIVMRASEEALKLVPMSIRHGSYALGGSQWQTVLRVVVPSALPAIITAVFLAIARVAGETAPLLLTASSNQYWPKSPNDMTPSLPLFIYTYSIAPYEDWHRQAWAAALVLIVVVMLLNFGVRLAAGKRVLQAARAG